MPQLNPEFYLSQIFWLFIIFSLLYLLVSVYFIPRIGGIVQKRAEIIEGDIDAATKYMEEAKLIKADIKSILDAARAEALSITDKAVHEAQEFVILQTAQLVRELEKQTALDEEKLHRYKSRLQVDAEGMSAELKEKISSILAEYYTKKK